MSELPQQPFRVRISVRSYELDALGHLNQAVYHSYAEHSRMELFRAAGCPVDGSEAAPVLLESHARYRKELRAGQEIDVTCEIVFGDRKVFAMNSALLLPDGTESARIECTLGLLDLTTRRLVANPRERMRQLAKRPELLGLA